VELQQKQELKMSLTFIVRKWQGYHIGWC